MSKSGFFIIDKPASMTSFDVVAKVRRALKETGEYGKKGPKVGHLGTLDPLATGALVLAVGEGTKLIEFLMGADKVYETQIELGKISTTFDREGELTILEENPDFSRDQVEAALLSFVGEIEQVPPAFSAIKIDGERAYAKARRGEEVKMKPRKVTVHSIKVRGVSMPHVMLQIHCGSGTYVRSIAHDLGQQLGCGGMMSELRRDSVGTFLLERAVSIEEATTDKLIPLEEVVADWPRLDLEPGQRRALASGQMIPKPHYLRTEESSFPVVAFYDGRLVSVLKSDHHLLRVWKNFR